MPEKALILPPLRRTIADARALASTVHEDQVDKAGRLYIRHLATVASYTSAFVHRMPCLAPLEREEAVQIAWLHDTIEDTSTRAADLLNEGFSPEVVTAVEMLTRKDGVSMGGHRVTYPEWIDWLCYTGWLSAILVKLADVEDNSDPNRLALLPEETRARLLRKYEPAKEVLSAAARQKGWQG